MDILIVGHGPGPKGKRMGEAIDRQETVVRFGDSGYWQDPADYGTRTDYILTGDQKHADVINIGRVPVETWVYGRPAFRDEPLLLARLKKYHPVICTATDGWLGRFAAIGARGYCTERAPQPHFSQGMAAIVMAADRLKARVIRLLGFEAMLSGDGERYESGVNRGHVIQAQHDFAAERRLLDEVQAHYGFEVLDGLV